MKRNDNTASTTTKSSKPAQILTIIEGLYLMCGVWATMARYSSEQTYLPRVPQTRKRT